MMAKGTEIATMPPLPVAFPSNVRSFIRRIPPGARVDVLRDDVQLASFDAEGSALNLANFREIVSRSVERDGHARFTICVDDHEHAFDSHVIVDVSTSGAEGSWQAFAQKMEGIVFRLLDKLDTQATKNAENLDRVLKSQRKLVASVSDLIRHDLERIDEARDGTAEEDSEMEKLKFARETLGMMGAGEGGALPAGAKSMRDRCLAAMKAEEKAAVLRTAEGQAMMEATSEMSLKVAANALFGLVKTGKLTLSKETLDVIVPILNGEA